jgi:hypothetical protein
MTNNSQLAFFRGEASLTAAVDQTSTTFGGSSSILFSPCPTTEHDKELTADQAMKETLHGPSERFVLVASRFRIKIIRPFISLSFIFAFHVFVENIFKMRLSANSYPTSLIEHGDEPITTFRTPGELNSLSSICSTSYTQAQNISHCISARIYRANSYSSSPINVLYCVNSVHPGQHRYVFATEHFTHPRRQPYVHDTTVKIRYRRKHYTFMLFFRRHSCLPPNLAVRKLAGVTMDGDVLVVACGTKVNVRGFRGRVEARAADIALTKLVPISDFIASI